MERIYLDKQIFSHLFKGVNPIYKRFLALLYENKEKFLYCYSHAHMLDLKNDKTDIKYDELKFMETLVGDNYLSYHANNKVTSGYLAKPLEVFRDVDKEEESTDFTKIFDDFRFDYLPDGQKEQVLLAKHLLLDQKIDFGFSQLNDIPDEYFGPLKAMFPADLGPISTADLSNHFTNFFKSVEADKTIYKDLRKVADQYINNGRFTVDYDSIDFNEDLRESVLGKSFIEYVESSLKLTGSNEYTKYDFYITAYFTLDLLGISKEPAKTVKFRNVMNDAYHSYYGAFCDYVISDDIGFLKKTRVLYRLLGIETIVYHIDDFMPVFNLLASSSGLNQSTFFDLLSHDLKNGFVLGSVASIQSDRITTTIKSIYRYIGYFNRIESIREDGLNYVLLRRSVSNYSNFSFYREYEGVINNAIRLFGIDSEWKGQFDWAQDIKLINEESWRGRHWNMGLITIRLEINKGINELCLLIQFK